jgi:hypothetical protein
MMSTSAFLVFSEFPSDASDNIHELVSGSLEEHLANEHSSKLRVGGWLDFLYQGRDTEGYRQIFDPHHFYFFLDAKLDNQWRSYVEIEFEHLPKIEGSETGGSSGEGEIELERLYIEYNGSDGLNSRVGKFNTPLGIWTPEHWAVLIPSVQKPIHEDNRYVPVKQVGLEGFGSFVLPSFELLTYNVWLSTGEDIFGTNKPTDNKFAYGADISASFSESVKFGLTGYLQNNPEKSGRKEKTVLPYAELYLPLQLTLTGEFLHQSRNAGFPNIDTWYLSAKWQVNSETYLYYRLDKGDDEKRGGGMTHTGHVLTLGHWPRPYVRMKLEFSNHDFDDLPKEDFNQWNAWMGVIF